MADFTFIEAKRWRDFFASVQGGEQVTFKAESPAEIEVVRAVASNINTAKVNPYVFSIRGDRETMKVTITTKERI